MVAVVLVAATFTISAAPAAAWGQGAPAKPAAKKKSLRDSLTGDAKAAFERGITLYQNSNFEGAQAEFDRAYKLSSDPRLLFNMAIAERDMKHYARAVQLLQRQLDEGKGSLSDEEKRTSSDVLEGLARYTAPLTIKVNEEGAQLFIDGRDTGLTTPLSGPVTVDVGERVITLRKAGFLESSKALNISGGTPASLDVQLEPSVRSGKLVVRATGAPSALVFVDGVERGPTPWEGSVAADIKHSIELRAKGYVTETRTQTVEYRSTSVIELALRPDQGRVKIETDNTDNAIFIDGERVGTGGWEGLLSSGGHQLTISRSGADTYNADLAVQTDQTRTVKISLNKGGSVPWYIWAAGGVLLVGGGVTAYLLTRPKTEEPQGGTISPFVVPVKFGL